MNVKSWKQFSLFLLVLIWISGCTPPEEVSFFVEGNCEECGAVMQKRLNEISGVKEVNWDFETSMATVSYHKSRVSPDQIQESLAKAGFNTQFYPGDEKARTSLPACCIEGEARKFKPSMPAHP